MPFELTPEQQQRIREVLTHQEDRARALGEVIGYGRMMQLGQQLWVEKLAAQGLPTGGAFAYGPCISTTQPCACTTQEFFLMPYQHCQWCCGSGWVTHIVYQAQTYPDYRPFIDRDFIDEGNY